MHGTPVKTAENLGPCSSPAARSAYRLDLAFAMKLEYIREKADRSRPAERASYTVPIQATATELLCKDKPSQESPLLDNAPSRDMI